MATTKCGFNDNPPGAGSDQLEAYGPTLMVDIGFDPNHRHVTGGIPVPGQRGLHALVDTGAIECCIDSDLAALNLPVVDRRKLSGSVGQHEVNVHLAQITIPSLNFVMNGLFSAVHLRAGGQLHSALIGRTFLRHFVMVYEGNTGTVILTSV